LLESARDFHSVYLCGFEPKNKDLHRAFKKVQSALEMVYHDELMNPASTKKIAFDEWHPSQRILVNELYKFIGLILKKNGPVWEKNPDVVCKTHTIEYRRTKKDIQNSMKQDKFNELDAEKELLSFSQDKRSIRVSKSIENLLSLDICPLSGPKNQEVKNLIPRLKESLDILYPEKRDSMMHFALKEADKLIPADNNACVNRTVTVVRECHDGVCEFVVQ
jgi:hypothetical protein